MADRPRVSLLMPVHDRAHLLERVLSKLAQTTTYEDLELIAVDDRSTDGSRAILDAWADSGRIPGMRVVAAAGQGAIAALNTALEASTGELCVQLDDDVTVETRGWVERMVELMAVDESVGVVTAKVVLDSGRLQCCGVNVVSPWGWHERGSLPAEPIGKRRWLNRTVERRLEGDGGPLEERVAEVDSGIGCCMMYRRADAVAVGGYDREWAPVWFDDVDLCMKIRALGRKVFYTPEVRVVHHFGTREEPRSGLARYAPGNVARALGRRLERRAPALVTRWIETRFAVDLRGDFTRAQCRLLRHHHRYWREKWGWDARNPDMTEVRRRWGNSEIWWAYDRERRAAGERIAAAHEAERRAAVTR